MMRKIVLGIVLLALCLSLVSAKETLPINQGKLLIETATVDVQFKDDILSDNLQISKGVVSTFNTVFITDENLNKPAKICFKGYAYLNPIAIHNGVWAMGTKVTQENLLRYCIEVDSWSYWQLVENTFPGTHENSTIRDLSLEKNASAVLIMRMDENTTAGQDFSFSSQTIDYSRPTYNTTDCYDTNCMYFDDDNDLIYNEGARKLQYNITQLTIFWRAKTTNLADSGGNTEDWYIGLLKKPTSMRFAFSTYDSQLYLYVKNDTDSTSSVSKSLVSTDATKWHSYTAIIDFNNDNLQYWQDGVNIGNNTLLGNYVPAEVSNLMFWMGGRYGTTYFADALIDDVQIYGRAITVDEAEALNLTDSIDDEPLIKYNLDVWNKYIPDDAIINDQSGNNSINLSLSAPPNQETVNCKYGNGCFNWNGISNQNYLTAQEKTTGGYPTVCAWVRNDEKTASEAYKIYDDVYIAGAGYTGTTLETYVLGSGTRAILFGISNGTAGVSQNVFLNPFGLDYGNNEWHHVCGNYNGSNINYYLDGSFIESDTAVYGKIGTSSYTPRIGERKGSTYLPMNGSIQCAQYWTYPVEDIYAEINNSDYCKSDWFEALDDSANELDGTCTQSVNCPVIDNQGKFNNSNANFNKNTYVSISDQALLDFNKSYTISAYIKCNETADDYILNKGVDGTVSYSMQIGGNCQHLYMYNKNSTQSYFTVTYNKLNSFKNKWVHVAATWANDMDDGRTKIYVNGNEVVDYGVVANSTGQLVPNNENLYFTSNIVPYRFVNVSMSCVEIWNKSLLPFQIKNHYYPF